MVNLLSPPSWTPVDGDGEVYPGALAYFYKTGTSTPQDTYSDFAATTANANPVVADADGRFAPIYLSADFDYKLVLKTAAGATVFTVDPVPLQSFQTTVVLNGSELDVMPFAQPQGRLTLSTGVPVMISNVAAAATVYYAPYTGNLVPIWDGTNMVPTTFAELSNILTNSATGKAGPATAGAYQNIDLVVWNDAGTVRLTRLPKWTKSATVTMTIAAPGVVTWTTHGLHNGSTVAFTTTGALPTGITAGTGYFVTVVDANSFKVSTTLANQIAGTFITTSGSQSGTHTAENYTIARGTGAGSCELERISGLWVNKYDITNGPLARKGTYVGTVYCDSASQVNWHTGAVAANGTPATLDVWNAYNRRPVAGFVGDTTASWTYTTATVRAANASATMRASFLQGLQEDYFHAKYAALGTTTGGAIQNIGVGYNTTAAFSGRIGIQAVIDSGANTEFSGEHGAQGIGRSYMSACEYSVASGTSTWAGVFSGGIGQTGLTYRGWF